eukprot:symbB.v1.2.035619.t1/scaffold4843.1/size33977/2
MWASRLPAHSEDERAIRKRRGPSCHLKTATASLRRTNLKISWAHQPLMMTMMSIAKRILYFEITSISAMGWIVGGIPDILGIAKTNFTEIWHGNFESLRPSTVDIPSIFLPNVSEITHMSAHEKEDRQHFWISAIAFAFFATILVGQALICLITASKSLKWCNGKDPVFEKLEDLEADFDGRGEKSSRSFQKIENALEADFDGTPEKSSRSNSLTWPRTLVAVSFAGNLTASCYALAMSKDSKQISKKYGVDWEYYFMLFVGCGLWTIAQATWATWNLAPEESLTLTLFGQACFASMAPILSDHYDTLKDAMFAFLCLESGSSAVQIMGWVSLLYLIGLHAYLIGFDEDALVELAESHLSGLQMTTKLKDRNSQPVPLKTEMWEFVVFTTYKQMTPTKRRLLLLENVPQAMFAVIYLLYEGGSMPVTIMNLGLPCVQTALAWLFFEKIRAIAGPLIGSKLRKFLLVRQQLRLRRLFKEANFADDIGLLKKAMPTMHPKYPIDRVEAEDFNAKDVVNLWEAVVWEDPSKLPCNLSFSSFELIKELQVWGDLGWNPIDEKGFEVICELIERSKMLKKLSLQNTGLDDRRLKAILERANHKIEELHLDGNSVTDFGVKDVKEQLQLMRSLKFIGFGWTLIGNEAAKVFAEVARQQKDLQMSVSGNKIGPEGLKALDAEVPGGALDVEENAEEPFCAEETFTVQNTLQGHTRVSAGWMPTPLQAAAKTTQSKYGAATNEKEIGNPTRLIETLLPSVLWAQSSLCLWSAALLLRSLVRKVHRRMDVSDKNHF